MYPIVNDEHIDDIKDDVTSQGADFFSDFDLVFEHSSELREAAKNMTSEDERIWSGNWDAYASFDYNAEAKYQFEAEELYGKQITEDTIEAYNDSVGLLADNIGHAMAQGLCNYLEVEDCGCDCCENNPNNE